MEVLQGTLSQEFILVSVNNEHSKLIVGLSYRPPVNFGVFVILF